ncbi:hypothetical protein JVT61DRAFT_9162 [Boletus reticuloceps]|uniref:Uncharacterized protein n=1 Tax=Boletus reticuloceps TaxID=495285 RepID=A0A8I3A5F7_9AGAM|nr:hypothetical protein JVT61DRAFT_9162 [Boletus reticuloceps]
MWDSLTVWQAYSLTSAPIICCAGSTVEGYTWAPREESASRQLLQSPWYTVFALCRSPSTATDLESLTSSSAGKLHVVKLDMTDQESVKTGAAEVLRILDGRGLDYVINTAAVVGSLMRG